MKKRWDLIVGVLLLVAALVWWLWPSCSTREAWHVAAAGGMACASDDFRFAEGTGKDGWCQQQAVSDLVVGKNLDVFFGLGDYQYEEAKSKDYAAVYDPSWGRVRAITRPALGNQEYKVHEANTFSTYFGGAVDTTKGWYSYEIGPWHIVVLNSNCAIVDGCGEGSEQLKWLRADLAKNDAACTLAYWHHPRFTTGLWGNEKNVDAFWRVLADAGADVVVAAHEHDYERFVPMDADGRPAADGIRSFVAGTGGQAVYGPDGNTAARGSPLAPNLGSARRIDNQHGVLFFTLTKDTYHWNFTGLDGEALDEGDGTCSN